MSEFKRVPRHIGIIPDGNRRWAEARGLPRRDGYTHAIGPSKKIFEDAWNLGIQEVSVYVFTKENTHRPRDQITSFTSAFLEFLDWVQDKDVSLLVVGDPRSSVFPKDALRWTKPAKDRQKKRRLNFLVNYSWKWDLSEAIKACKNNGHNRTELLDKIGSRHVPTVDLVIRWGGRTRLSGFLPVQTAYADIYVLDTLWPDCRVEHFYEALRWYEKQDTTMGG